MIFSIGLLIPGFGYLVTSGQINPDGFLFFIPLMLYGLAFILTVELPDMESDRLGRKMTWVAQKGRSFGLTLNSDVISLCDIILLILSVVDIPQLPSGFSFFRCPFSIASWSRLFRFAQETFRKTISYLGCQ